MRILVVDDEEMSRKLLHSILSRFGRCDTAENGEAALKSFLDAWEEGAPYDLVCLDIMMPGMNGHEALKTIRRLEKERGIVGNDEVKIVMTSALDDPRNVVEAYYRGGASAYVVKPVIKEKLMNELRKLGLPV